MFLGVGYVVGIEHLQLKCEDGKSDGATNETPRYLLEEIAPNEREISITQCVLFLLTVLMLKLVM